jgi:hypothetical protein
MEKVAAREGFFKHREHESQHHSVLRTSAVVVGYYGLGWHSTAHSMQICVRSVQ